MAPAPLRNNGHILREVCHAQLSHSSQRMHGGAAMRLWFWLTGAAMLLAAWLAMRGPADGPVPPLARTAGGATLQSVLPPPPDGIRVHGVLRGPGAGSRPQAVLSVGGSTTHVFGVGEPVAQGWSLAAVEQDHVILAHGPARTRVDLLYSV